MVKTRNTRSSGGGGGGGIAPGPGAGDNAATLRPSSKKGRKRRLTESSGPAQASMLTASSALSPLPGPSSALVAPGVSGLLPGQEESDWQHLAPPNNNQEHFIQDTDHDIVPVAGDLVIFSPRDTTAPVNLTPLTTGEEDNCLVKEDGTDSLVLPEDLKQVRNFHLMISRLIGGLVNFCKLYLVTRCSDQM